jgi:hypothetical protein
VTSGESTDERMIRTHCGQHRAELFEHLRSLVHDLGVVSQDHQHSEL